MISTSAKQNKRSNEQWKKDLEILKAQKTELARYGGMMSEYERMVNQRTVKDSAERLYPVIYAATVGPFKTSIKRYQDALQAITASKTKEIQRFDAGKLNAEMDYAGKIASMAVQDNGSLIDSGSQSTVEKLQQLYNEAAISDDIHKKRATLEVIKNTLPKGGGNRIEINALSKQAGRDLEVLRTTDEMARAQSNADQALAEMLERHQEVADAAALLEGDINNVFNYGSFSKAHRMVQIDANHELHIYDESAPEVTGVYWKNPPVEADNG